MRISRRLVLLHGLATVLVLRARAVFGQHMRPASPAARITSDEKALGAWLDTLLPADSESPSASELGIHSALQKMAASNRQVSELLAGGLAWLDKQARAQQLPSFQAAPGAVRDAIASTAEAAPDGSPQRQFFLYTLHESYKFYYSNPRSWPALKFQGPPQPGGYPDFTQAPG